MFVVRFRSKQNKNKFLVFSRINSEKHHSQWQKGINSNVI